MPFEIAVYIHVNDPGLPIWQVVPLSILGCAIAFGLIWGVVALAGLSGASLSADWRPRGNGEVYTDNIETEVKGGRNTRARVHEP